MKPVPAFIVSLSEIRPHFLLSAQHSGIHVILEKRVICWSQFHYSRIPATVMSTSLKQEILKSLAWVTLHVCTSYTKPKRIRDFFLVPRNFFMRRMWEYNTVNPVRLHPASRLWKHWRNINQKNLTLALIFALPPTMLSRVSLEIQHTTIPLEESKICTVELFYF